MFDRLRQSSSIFAGFINFNLDFWLTMPSIAVSVSLSQEANLKLIGGMVLWCVTLIALSVAIDGWDRAIIARPGLNPRKAYNIITNKKISDLIRQVKGQTASKDEREKNSIEKELEGKPDGSTTASSQIINF